MRLIISGIVFLICVTGCTKDFPLDPDQVKEIYVIEGRISNLKGPYFVRVTRSMGLYLPENWWNGVDIDTATPVTNALVIITDDSGVADTLIPATNKFEGMTYGYYNGVIDSMYQTGSQVNITRERGFYQTTKLQGAPGGTYRLRVETDGQVFESSASMPSVPVIEHVELRDTTVAPYTNVGSIPVAYFRDPPGEKNYYMIKVGDISKFPYDDYFEKSPNAGPGMGFIDYYFFDDKALVSGLNAIPAQLMFDPTRFDRYPFSYGGTGNGLPMQVRLCSLTKETYDYIKSLSKQIINDGNVYKPVPFTPQGNISGGALGLFFASQISYKLLLE